LLIKEAIANRKMLINRIEKEVETGSLFERYYGKMQAINKLTNKAYTLMQKMNSAKFKYEYDLEVYKKMMGIMYLEKLSPNESVLMKKNEKADIWEVMYKQRNSIEDGDYDE